MQFEGAPERAKPFIEPSVWAELQPFNVRNDLHLDRLTEGLLASFLKNNDADAFKALVELLGPRLEQLADQITEDLAVIMRPSDLVSTLMGRLFITTEASGPPPKHFLADAAERMTAEAEAWIRDYAMADVTPTDLADGELGPKPNTVTQGYRNIVQICYHRLDISHRRFLFAHDVRGLSVAQVASRYNLTVEQAAKAIHDAKHRLDELVQAAQEGGSA